MVKKTKRFRYKAKKEVKENIVREIKPKPEIINKSIDTPSNKKRRIIIASIAIAIMLVIAVVLTIQLLTTSEISNESSALNIPRSTSEIIDQSDPNVIFKLYVNSSEKISDNTYSKIIVKPRDDIDTIYSYLKNTDNSTIVVYPSFTRTAYEPSGIAHYYQTQCTSCITSRIIYDDVGAYGVGHTAYQVLKILGYEFITDVDIDKNPKILSKYDKVILLHNEYATQNMFDAITSHSNVVYLYPGALSIKTTADYVAEQLLLLRGYGYPDASVGNGFDWEFDNVNLTDDNTCQNWEFYKINNGHMLNCYPESIIHLNPLLLLSLKEIDDPYWKNPLQNYADGDADKTNQLKLMLLNDEITKLLNPQLENQSSSDLNGTIDDNVTESHTP
ncbi:MAG: putative exported protein [Cenarchaeum symbiont of Oopsacas minuta]|nr:putative exported protein [Cenarchaeum symbiont of Oopsacas minuta]